MATFAIRVELHGATSDDYERLHAFMAVAGFVRTIELGDKTFHLPPGEYRYHSNFETSMTVCAKAQAVAAQVRSSPAVVVDEVVSRAGVGLEPVNSIGWLANALAAGAGMKHQVSTSLLSNGLAEAARFGLGQPYRAGLVGNALMANSGLGLKR